MTGFYSHRKTVRLFSKIGSDAFWLPPRLWAYCAENQPDGDLSGYQPDELAMLVGYKGDALSMLVALKDCGFMDLEGHIHDWKEHNGYHEKYSVRAKTAANARWSKVSPQTPLPKKEDNESGNRKGESGDKHCLEHATSIKDLELTTNARVLLHTLNETTGKHFRESETSLKPIMARLSEPEVDVDGCKQMIKRQTEMWKGTSMAEYLRPETLFGKTKFNGYYAGKDQPIIKQSQINGVKHHAQPDHDAGF